MSNVQNHPSTDAQIHYGLGKARSLDAAPYLNF